jgi:RNA polymerase sigma-70 factor (ECF subfamily)
MPIIDAIQKNKQQVFMDLYKPAHEKVYRFVKTLIWDKEEAKDIVNETALIAFEKFETIKNKDLFVAYLFGIASNLCKKNYRIKKIKAVFDWTKADDNEAWQNAEENINTFELNKLLEHLSFEQRRALLLFELSGFSYEEISKIEKCSLSAVKSRIFSAKKILQKVINKEDAYIQNKLFKSIVA